MLRAYKTELDLNNKQRTLMIRYCGVARFVYNWALADRIERYKNGEKTNKFEQKKRFTSLKDEQFPWVREVAYAATESAFENCDKAYQNFFRGIKNKSAAGFPKFKSKKKGYGNFTLRGSIHVFNDSIQLPRIGILRLKESGYLPDNAKILSATISERAGHWFVSLQVEVPDKEIVNSGTGVIGVDLGIKTLATCSNGITFDNPKSLRLNEKRLTHLQRELSRRVKGSKNRNKTKQKIAKLHYRIANIRRYALHEVSNYLTVKVKPETIVLEDLNVRGMMQNRHLSKSIAEASFSELRRQLEYKCQWYGVDLVIADRFYPSSKTCSECGSVKPLLKLSERTFVCEKCGAIIDRDFNASLNLARLGSSSLNLEPSNKRGLPVEGVFGNLDNRTAPVKQELGSLECKSEITQGSLEPGIVEYVNPGLPYMGISTSGAKHG